MHRETIRGATTRTWASEEGTGRDEEHAILCWEQTILSHARHLECEERLRMTPKLHLTRDSETLSGR